MKHFPDGYIKRYKDLLVAKGFHKHFNLDYHYTFSPIAKPIVVCSILCHALSWGWTLQQRDVNNTYLHGNLYGAMYMSQPPGFVDENNHCMFASCTRHYIELNRSLGLGIWIFGSICVHLVFLISGLIHLFSFVIILALLFFSLYRLMI